MTNKIDKGIALINFATIMLILSTLITLAICFIFYLYETNEFGIKSVVLVMIMFIYGIYLMRYEMHTEPQFNPIGEKTRLLIFIIMSLFLMVILVMMMSNLVELISIRMGE